jgi:hypothetical protein
VILAGAPRTWVRPPLACWPQCRPVPLDSQQAKPA